MHFRHFAIVSKHKKEIGRDAFAGGIKIRIDKIEQMFYYGKKNICSFVILEKELLKRRKERWKEMID